MAGLDVRADPALHFRVQQFLFHEAQLLDDRLFDQWIALFEPDGEYWIPMAWRQPDPYEHISLLYESVEVLTMRMQRLKELAALSQRPFSRTCHHVSNVMVNAENAETVSVRSALIVIEYRRDEQRTFGGHARHDLSQCGSTFRIRRKRVDLLNCDTELGHVRISVPF
jgi:3-phenylpropionate/cinnamic acid dioxygenase small subunit